MPQRTVMQHAGSQALARQGVCSCSYAQPPQHCAPVHPLVGGRRLLSPRATLSARTLVVLACKAHTEAVN